MGLEFNLINNFSNNRGRKSLGREENLFFIFKNLLQLSLWHIPPE